MQPLTPIEHPGNLLTELAPNDILWLVDAARQQISFWKQGHCLLREPVSTSAHGFGNEPGSHQTPLGWHRAADIIGRDAPLGQRFVSREPVGEPLKIWQGGEGDAILSRIVILDGLIPGLNHLSRERYIYIHGTNQEERLGHPSSHGCIRMGNKALADWINLLGPALPHVWIGHVDNDIPAQSRKS